MATGVTTECVARFIIHAAGSPSVSCNGAWDFHPDPCSLQIAREANDQFAPRKICRDQGIFGSNLALPSPVARSTCDLNCMHKPQGGLAKSWGMCAALAALLAEICGTAPALQHTVRAALKSAHRLLFQAMATDAPLLPSNRFDGDRSKPAFVPG